MTLMRDASRLSRDFYTRDPVAVARGLLGQRLVRVLDDGSRLAGLVVETEAYLGLRDKAAHTYRGRKTRRNASMWREGGHAYVYFTYGMHHCLNAVAGVEGHPVAVLVRALQPTEGLARMHTLRGGARRERDLCSGPGKLCQALAIDRRLDGADLVAGGALFVEQLRARAHRSSAIVRTTRVGVDYAGEWAHRPLRFYLRENVHVSRR